MIITVIVDDVNPPLSIQLEEEEDVQTLAQIIQLELSLPSINFQMLFNGKVISQGPLRANGIKSDEVIILKHDVVHSASSSVASSQVPSHIPPDITPEGLIAITKENPQLLSQLALSEPDLARSISENDLPSLRKLLMARYLAHHKKIYETEQELKQIESNPDSEENQKKIAERIQQQNIQENLAHAMETIPESFSQVEMLYIPCQINNHDIRAFVDSGAQMTIMSAVCAERCGLSRLIDRRYSGEARGVGTGKIIGRVHIAQLKLGETYFAMSITILESSDVEFLFGLDMLRRHRCAIDLAKNALRIEGHSGCEEIPFI